MGRRADPLRVRDTETRYMTLGQLLWFLTVGWWLAPLWFTAGVVASVTPLAPVGWIVVYQTPAVASGSYIGLGD